MIFQFTLTLTNTIRLLPLGDFITNSVYPIKSAPRGDCLQPNQVNQNGSSDCQGPHTGGLVITYISSTQVM